MTLSIKDGRLYSLKKAFRFLCAFLVGRVKRMMKGKDKQCCQIHHVIEHND